MYVCICNVCMHACIHARVYLVPNHKEAFLARRGVDSARRLVVRSTPSNLYKKKRCRVNACVCVLLEWDHGSLEPGSRKERGSQRFALVGETCRSKLVKRSLLYQRSRPELLVEKKPRRPFLSNKVLVNLSCQTMAYLTFLIGQRPCRPFLSNKGLIEGLVDEECPC